MTIPPSEVHWWLNVADHSHYIEENTSPSMTQFIDVINLILFSSQFWYHDDD